jgi:type I restriction enzyme S subunit
MHLHHFLSLVIPLPPVGEQKRIVAKVNELFALCDQLAGQVTAAEASREQLLTAILAQAG